MKIKEITSYLESIAPLSYQESYDNSGLIIGDPNDEVDKVLISLDCTEEVVQEAIDKGCNLIISHHPVVFQGLKRFNGSNYVERTVIKAIRNKIAIYAIHTNLDNVNGGVNFKIAEKLGLAQQAILKPKSGQFKKLVVYVPRSHVEEIRNSLFAAGAGSIGDYEECSFNTAGYGTFKPVKGANPTLGKLELQERVEETKIEVVFAAYLERDIIVSMLAVHPYEEVAYHVVTLDNHIPGVGSGVIGNLEVPVAAPDFLGFLKEKLRLSVIRHTALSDRSIQRVAVCGGAGSFLLKDAQRSGADIFITADYKYHDFFDAENKIIVADIGHFESEQFTQELLLDIITKKFANFAVLITETDTNPIKYYC